MPSVASGSAQMVASVRWSNRQFARSGETHSTMIHFQKCYTTMQELFHHRELLKHLPPGNKSIAFLDIACAPGGFSQFLLDHYQRSIGYGITLPVKSGGFPVTISPGDPHRYYLSYFDLLAHPLDPHPTIVNSIDIAIGDAQYFPRSQEAIDEYKGKKAGTVTGGRIALLLREFILAFESLKQGGSFIFRFVVWEKVHANILRLFFLCFELFEHVEPFKSEYQHTADCTFYAVCCGFNREKYDQLNVAEELSVAYARVVLSPPFAAVHNGTVNCFRVISHSMQNGRGNADSGDHLLDKLDAHILEGIYPFREIQTHPHFNRTCTMFERDLYSTTMGCQCSKSPKAEEAQPASPRAVLVVEHVSPPKQEAPLSPPKHTPEEVVVSKEVVQEIVSVAAVLKTASAAQEAESAGKISASKKKRMKKKAKATVTAVQVETKDDEYADARSEPAVDDRNRAMRDEAYFSADNATPAKGK